MNSIFDHLKDVRILDAEGLDQQIKNLRRIKRPRAASAVQPRRPLLRQLLKRFWQNVSREKQKEIP